ncbi:MAG: PEGA domain-containing protein [Nitrospirota bacterium]
MKKKIIILSILILASMLFQFVDIVSAHVRVVVGPWWPRAIVFFPIVPAPAPVVVPPPPPPAKPYLGYINVNVHPKDAEVSVDGEYRGIADDFDGIPSYLVLSEGSHKITFRKKGYSSVSFVVNVIPAQAITLDITMETIKEETAPSVEERIYQLDMEGVGYVELDIKPSDAVIYIDGYFYGVASQFKETAETVALKSGSHQIEILKPGYVTYTANMLIEKGKTKILKITLDKKE